MFGLVSDLRLLLAVSAVVWTDFLSQAIDTDLYATEYLEEICNKTIIVGGNGTVSALALKATRNRFYSLLYTECSAIIIVNKQDDGLIVVVKDVDLNEISEEGVKDELSVDYNGFSTYSWEGSDEGNPTKEASFLALGYIEVTLRQLTPNINTKHTGFLMLITAFKSSKQCASKYFQCEPGICLNNSYLCDSQDNCGNGKDEANCEMLENGSQLLVISVASVFAFGCFLFIAYFFGLLRKRRSDLNAERVPLLSAVRNKAVDFNDDLI